MLAFVYGTRVLALTADNELDELEGTGFDPDAQVG